MASEDLLRERARQRAEDKAGFFVHLGIYLAVNAFFWVIWWFTGPGGFPWPVFIMAAWGIGVVAHGIGAFAGGSFVDRMAEKEYQRMKGEKP